MPTISLFFTCLIIICVCTLSDCNDVLCHETGVLEMIDLSNNLLTGQVPSEFGQFVDLSVFLAGNINM